MSIISLEFLLFFAASVLCSKSVSQNKRHIALLFSSLIFSLSFGTKAFLIMLSVCAVSYISAAIISKFRSGAVLAAAVIFDLIPLLLFKYGSFLNMRTASLFTSAAGISFYVFRALSYNIDIYQNKTSLQKNFLKHTLYISFFPEILSGPIERSDNFYSALDRDITFDVTKTSKALRTVLLGIFKKVVIADGLKNYTSAAFDNASLYSSSALVLAVFMYSIYIYCDFSGYSDIAHGAAVILGFEPPENFRAPYFARNIKEFWNRWHISLSTFFRDYIYIPLGGNRCSLPRCMLNLFVVFIISGIWHGSGLNFIIWGALHGIGIIIFNLYSKSKSGKTIKIPRFLSVLLTFLFCSLAWIFFASKGISEALSVIFGIFKFRSGSAFLSLGLTLRDIIRFTISISAITAYEAIGEKKIADLKPHIRALICVFAAIMIYFFIGGASGEFVYFNF